MLKIVSRQINPHFLMIMWGYALVPKLFFLFIILRGHNKTKWLFFSITKSSNKAFSYILKLKCLQLVKQTFYDTNQNVTNCSYHIQVLDLKTCLDKKSKLKPVPRKQQTIITILIVLIEMNNIKQALSTVLWKVLTFPMCTDKTMHVLTMHQH